MKSRAKFQMLCLSENNLHELQEFELSVSAALSLHLNLQKRCSTILSSFKSQVLHCSEKDSQIQKESLNNRGYGAVITWFSLEDEYWIFCNKIFETFYSYFLQLVGQTHIYVYITLKWIQELKILHSNSKCNNIRLKFKQGLV